MNINLMVGMENFSMNKIKEGGGRKEGGREEILTDLTT